MKMINPNTWLSIQDLGQSESNLNGTVYIDNNTALVTKTQSNAGLLQLSTMCLELSQKWDVAIVFKELSTREEKNLCHFIENINFVVRENKQLQKVIKTVIDIFALEVWSM